jgi:hypothetical protein
MSDSDDRKPGGFDGEEATEILPMPRAPNKTIEMRAPPAFDEPPPQEDEDGPLRKYLAPRVLAVQPVPEQRPEDHKIVINVRTPTPTRAAPVEAPGAVSAAEAAPDAKLDADRARRRAPTVRIARGTLAAQGMLPSTEGAIDVSFDDEGDAPGSSVSRSRPERREPSTGKRIAIGVVLTVVVGGVVAAALVLTGTLPLPNLETGAKQDPGLEPAASGAASSEPAASSAPSATAAVEATSAPSAAHSASPTSASATASAAPSTVPGATAPRRYAPPPRPFNRPPQKANPTTL